SGSPSGSEPLQRIVVVAPIDSPPLGKITFTTGALAEIVRDASTREPCFITTFFPAAGNTTGTLKGTRAAAALPCGTLNAMGNVREATALPLASWISTLYSPVSSALSASWPSYVSNGSSTTESSCLILPRTTSHRCDGAASVPDFPAPVDMKSG